MELLGSLLVVAVGIGAIVLATVLLRYKGDWLVESSTTLGTRIDPEKRDLGHKWTRRLSPIVLLIWGLLMLGWGVSLLV
jgi:hypothetical protein